jgi:molybdopterin-guanine dinucleotide biosynthesis protein MobB
MAAADVNTCVIGIVGYKDNGKTTLTVRLVEHLTRAGYRVSTVKHAHHQADIDQPGRDSWRHREAGATEVLLSTSRRWMMVHELRGEPEPSLDELLPKMAPVDLVIVEGFKRNGHPKIEVHRTVRGTPLLAREDTTIVAIATDAKFVDFERPIFGLDDIEAIAAFIRSLIMTR